MPAPTRITRRTLLRGAGAALALPFLEAMLPRALAGGAAARPPLRLGIVSVTGGTVIESWKPAVGALDRLPSILRPLEPFKDELLVLSGLAQSGRSEGLNAHESCALMHLTGAPLVRKVNGRFHAGISVDQAAANVVGRETYLPSLEMGFCHNQYSFRAADAPLPSEANPRLIFDRMFRGRQPVVPNWARRATAPPAAAAPRPDTLDLSVIDLVLDETHGLHQRLGAADRRRLDEYLHAIRSVERRTALLGNRLAEEERDRARPGPSTLHLPPHLPPAGTPTWQVTRNFDRDADRMGEYIRLLSDLMVLAFQTDTTRVVTLAAGSDEAQLPGIITVGYEQHCHTLEHQGNAARPEDADPIAREACRQVHAWYTQLFAELVRKLRAVDEGGSSLLDNSMILYTSYMADGGHGTRDYPVLLAGRAQGRLHPGRHLAFQANTPMANLYVEMLNRLGVPTTEFGDSRTSPHAAHGGRLPGLS